MFSGFTISIRKRSWGGALRRVSTGLRNGPAPPPRRASPLIQFSFCGFSLGQLESENSRNKQFLSFKVHGTLSRMMKSHTVPHHPAQDTDHVSGVSALQVPPTCRSLSSRLSYRTDCRGVCIQVTLIYLIMPHPRAFYYDVLL